MSRPILIYGQSGAGKSYSLRNLDPKTTFIIDADAKGELSFEDAEILYTEENENFRSYDDLEKIIKRVEYVGTNEKMAHIKTLVIDGISKALIVYEATYNLRTGTKNKFERFEKLKELGTVLFRTIKHLRKDLTVVVIGNVTLADPFQNNAIDKLKVPGSFLKDSYEIESDFNYVLYAKVVDGQHIFETYSNRSSVKSKPGVLPPEMDNDVAEVIRLIDEYTEKRRKALEASR